MKKKIHPRYPTTRLAKALNSVADEIYLLSTEGFNPDGGEIVLGFDLPQDEEPPLVSSTTSPSTASVQPTFQSKEQCHYAGIEDNKLIGVSRGVFGYKVAHHPMFSIVRGQDSWYEEPEVEEVEVAPEITFEEWLKKKS